MPGFYLRPQVNAPVSQGDIFFDVPLIGVSLVHLRQVVKEGERLKAEPVEPDAIKAGMYLIEYVETTNAVVISQSCDAERDRRLMLAPLRDFPMEGNNATKKWKKINQSATSLGAPGDIYLPGNPTLELSRSLANFGEAFTLPREFLDELAQRGKRVAGLGDRAVAYLQFRLGVLLARVAQDDFAWPSGEDLDIKIASLGEQIAAADKKMVVKVEEMKKADGATRDNLAAEIEEMEAEISSLKKAQEKAAQARPDADKLANGLMG